MTLLAPTRPSCRHAAVAAGQHPADAARARPGSASQLTLTSLSRPEKPPMPATFGARGDDRGRRAVTGWRRRACRRRAPGCSERRGQRSELPPNGAAAAGRRAGPGALPAVAAGARRGAAVAGAGAAPWRAPLVRPRRAAAKRAARRRSGRRRRRRRRRRSPGRRPGTSRWSRGRASGPTRPPARSAARASAAASAALRSARGGRRASTPPRPTPDHDEHRRQPRQLARVVVQDDQLGRDAAGDRAAGRRSARPRSPRDQLADAGADQRGARTARATTRSRGGRCPWRS